MFKLFRPGTTVALDTAGIVLGKAATIDDVVAGLRNSARAVARADGITVVRRIGDEVAYVGEDAISPLWTGRRFPIRTCVSGMAMLSRAPIVIPDIALDPRVPLHLYLSTFVRRMAMFPIGPDEPHMAVGAYWRTPGSMDDAALERLAALVEQAGEAIARIEDAETGRQVA